MPKRSYDPGMCARVRDMGELSATKAEIAKHLGVSVASVGRWMASHPEFGSAVRHTWDPTKRDRNAPSMSEHPASETFSFRVTPEDAVAIDGAAERVGCTRAELIRNIVLAVVHSGDEDAVFDVGAAEARISEAQRIARQALEVVEGIRGGSSDEERS